ncbi:MAG: hypothetical protein JW881_01895 [Spirochaetales bacterium]|nr:hypothetical protein [Spirochaetales bacterium]
MAQLTIYLDNKTIKKIEKTARESNVSVSKWVRDKLELIMENDWPESYFSVFGTLDDNDIDEPKAPHPDDDVKRESL